MTATYDADARPADMPRRRARKRYRKDVRTLADLDGRTAPARRARDLAARLRADLGHDPSAAEAELIAGCTLLSILTSDAGVKILRNEAGDVHALTALVNCSRRAYAALGCLTRDPKLIEPVDTIDADAQFKQELLEALEANAS
jgi:hypothetical protein